MTFVAHVFSSNATKCHVYIPCILSALLLKKPRYWSNIGDISVFHFAMGITTIVQRHISSTTSATTNDTRWVFDVVPRSPGGAQDWEYNKPPIWRMNSRDSAYSTITLRLACHVDDEKTAKAQGYTNILLVKYGMSLARAEDIGSSQHSASSLAHNPA